MTAKKLLVLMIAPLFVVGMAACGTDEPAADDVWTEEGQLPAYEAEEPVLDEPAYDVEDDTIVIDEMEPDAEDEEEATEPDAETEG